MRMKRKKDLHIRERNGLSVSHVCIGLCFFCMYFYPTASRVLYLNTAFFICPVRMKKLFFFVYCGTDFNPRKANATGISDGVYDYFLQ